MNPLSITPIRETVAMPHDEIWAIYNDPNATADDLEKVIASIYGYAEFEEEE